PEALQRAIERLLDALRVAHVARRREALVAGGLAQLGRRGGEALLLAAHDRDARAVREVGARDALADARATAGDERDLPVEDVAPEHAHRCFLRARVCTTCASTRRG